MITNHYTVLGVSENATEEEIKKAYRILAKKYHPDATKEDKKLEEEFKKIGNSYAILINPQKRKEHDIELQIQKQNKVNNNYSKNIFNDIFNNIFNDNFFGEFGSSFNGFNSSFENEIKSDYEIKQDEEAYDEFVKFYNEQEEEFASLGFTLEKEYGSYKLFQNRGVISRYDYYNLKAEIKNKLFNLKRDIEAYNKYITFYEEIKAQFEALGFTLNSHAEYLEEKNRGIVSRDKYNEITKVLKDSLHDLEKKLVAYDQFMIFLNEVEEKLKQYNKTISPSYKEDIMKKRGKISPSEIQDFRREWNLKLNKYESNARAFNRFKLFYEEIKVRLIPFSSEFDFSKYLDPKNMCSFNYLEINEVITKINNKLRELETKRNKKLNILKEKLVKRNIDILDYLSSQKNKETNEIISLKNITISQIDTMLSTMNILDEMDLMLSEINIDAEKYLILQGKLLDIKNADLRPIWEFLNEYKNNYQRLDESLKFNKYEDLKTKMKQEKEEKIEYFKEWLQKRNIDINEYLQIRVSKNNKVLTLENICIWELDVIFKSFKMIDEIEFYCGYLNMTLEAYLATKGIDLLTIKYKELKNINEELKEYVNNVIKVDEVLQAGDNSNLKK